MNGSNIDFGIMSHLAKAMAVLLLSLPTENYLKQQYDWLEEYEK